MEVVGHQAKMQYLHLGMMALNAQQTIHQCISQGRALHIGLLGVIVWDDKDAQARLTVGNGQGDMIEAGALPGSAWLLPLPFLRASIGIPCHCQYFHPLKFRMLRRYPHA